jgi:hypothetical protein
MSWIKPTKPSFIIGTLNDLTRPNSQLIAENALLRQQLIVLNRQIKKPEFTPLDRLLLVWLASMVQSWKQALLIVKPDTLLHWHRQGFKLFWKIKSKSKNLNQGLVRRRLPSSSRWLKKIHYWERNELEASSSSSILASLNAQFENIYEKLGLGLKKHRPKIGVPFFATTLARSGLAIFLP